MKIITNTKLIQRNAKIAKYTFYVSLGILGIGMYISFKYPNDPNMITWMMTTLVVGFLLSQLSLYYQNRWGKSPRPDEQLTAALKGLDDKYTLFHYASPTNHLLVSPSGIWGLIPYNQNGTIVFEKNRWKQKGGSWLMKLFGGENLGRPELDAEALQRDVLKSLRREIPEETLPQVKVAFVFTNPKVKIEAEEAPIPTIPVAKLKEFLRKTKKTDILPQEDVDKYSQFFETNYKPKE
jgi:hypothetical protein